MVAEQQTKNTEEVILDSAMKVFTRRGYAAARMEEIAKEAGINRALLHYYFRDKETMFNLIFERRFKDFFMGFFGLFESDAPFFEKIEAMIDHEINLLIKHPDLARFIIMEIAQQPERLIQYGQKLGINPRVIIQKFRDQVDEEVANGTIKPIDSRQLIMNIISLCVYPFVAKPIVKTMMQMDENSFIQVMEQRKKDAFGFIKNALTP